jgi:hypothetical protein
MNLKRYIDAAVRREVRKVFIRDADFDSLINNIKLELNIAKNLAIKTISQTDTPEMDKRIAYANLEHNHEKLSSWLLSLNQDLRHGKLFSALVTSIGLIKEIPKVNNGLHPGAARAYNNAKKDITSIYRFLKSSKINSL